MESTDTQFVFKINKPIVARGILDSIKLGPNQKEIHIFLGDRVFFNSLGIREWILWLAPFRKKEGIKIFLYECSVVTMRQVNMLVDFLPENAEINSFYVPYASEHNGETRLVLFTKGKEYDRNKLNLPKVLDAQGNEMELDVMEKTYFHFLFR